MLLTFAILGGMGYLIYLWITQERTEWTHPTLSLSEQEKATATCRLEARREVGTKWWSEYQGYIADCLTAKGFTLEEIDG